LQEVIAIYILFDSLKTIIYNTTKKLNILEGMIMEKEQEPKKFRIEEDWFSFYVGIILGLLVIAGIIKHIPW